MISHIATPMFGSLGTRVGHKFLPLVTQFRFRKEPRRKPRWLPRAPTKLYKIPVHPYVSPEEKKLFDDLLDEYERKMLSIRKLFQIELDKTSDTSALGMELARIEEEEHRKLMEENDQENERIRKIREEAEEINFKLKEKTLLEKYEVLLAEQQKAAIEADEIVREVKKYSGSFVTSETLDEAIEKAIDNPVNINFSIDLKGNIEWEGTPPPEYESRVKGTLSMKK